MGRRELPDHAPHRGVGRVLVLIAPVAIGVLPPFLTGALAVLIRAELGLGPAALGAVVTWFFGASASVSGLMGRLIEQRGVRTGLTVGAAASAAGLLIASVAGSVPMLLAAMTLAGVGNALIQPSVNAELARSIRASRQGLAFGVKQAAIPTATLLAGLAVPTVAVLVGWRGTYRVAAVLAVVVLVAGSRVVTGAVRTRPSATRAALGDRGALRVAALAGALGAMSATSLGVFLLDTAVGGGIEPGRAGLLVAVVSAVGLLTRVGLGWQADAFPARSRYGTIGGLLLTAVPGYLLLAGGAGPVLLIGALLAYAAGWSWPGLFHLAVVRQSPEAPAAATGVVQIGVSLGAGAGPLLLGLLAEHGGYRLAWQAAAVLSAAAAAGMLLTRARLRRTGVAVAGT